MADSVNYFNCTVVFIDRFSCVFSHLLGHIFLALFSILIDYDAGYRAMFFALFALTVWP